LTLSCEIRSKGFVKNNRDRRQVAQAAHRLGPKDKKNVGGGPSFATRPDFVSLQRLVIRRPLANPLATLAAVDRGVGQAAIELSFEPPAFSGCQRGFALGASPVAGSRTDPEQDEKHNKHGGDGEERPVPPVGDGGDGHDGRDAKPRESLSAA
jgi:hypothetical protein